MRIGLKDIRLRLRHFALEIDVELGEDVTGIFGPSGSGKTSLLDLIAGLRKAQTGAVSLDGDCLFDSAKRIFVSPRYRRIGYVPQDLALFPHINVRANLTYGLRRHMPADELFGLSHVAEIMEIQHLFDSPVTQLSGGEQQRVAFARAILSRPRLMLLDEPMSSLDSRLKKRLIPFLRSIRDEFRIPFLYVSHDAAELGAFCDEVLMIENGRIIRRGSPAILTN
jgi:molybdate transport system ATP-binding protein